MTVITFDSTKPCPLIGKCDKCNLLAYLNTYCVDNWGECPIWNNEPDYFKYDTSGQTKKPDCLGDQTECGTEQWEGCPFQEECDSLSETKTGEKE